MANATDAALEALLLKMQSDTCYPYTEGIQSAYKYFPSFAAGIIFCLLFGICFFYHTFQSIRLRAATSILLALGAFSTFTKPHSHHNRNPQEDHVFLMEKNVTNLASSLFIAELVGWGARTYSAKCPYNHNAFLAQEVTLIIAPVFFSAALYVLLGQLIVRLGPRSSLLTARWYAIIFCTCDVASLVVQAIGGAKASEAETDDEMLVGTHIMVGGIAFQLLTMTLFGGLVADFLWRVGLLGKNRGGELRDQVTGALRRLLAALLVSFAMIYVRSVYRTIELAQGWRGYLITHEAYFIALDAAIMVVAVAVFVPVDPAVVLRGEGCRRRRSGKKAGFSGRAGRGEKGALSTESDAEVGLATDAAPGSTRY